VQAILLATVPDATTAARAVNSDLNVIIDWDETTFDGASAILGYRVKIKGADGLYREEPNGCNSLDGAAV
jgi:hypothetical protein